MSNWVQYWLVSRRVRWTLRNWTMRQTGGSAFTCVGASVHVCMRACFLVCVHVHFWGWLSLIWISADTAHIYMCNLYNMLCGCVCTKPLQCVLLIYVPYSPFIAVPADSLHLPRLFPLWRTAVQHLHILWRAPLIKWLTESSIITRLNLQPFINNLYSNFIFVFLWIYCTMCEYFYMWAYIQMINIAQLFTIKLYYN